MLEDAGKKFQRQWIFRHLDYAFERGVLYAVNGANGSGKSTLLRTIAGIHTASEGKLSYSLDDGRPLDYSSWYRYLSYSAPGMSLLPAFTLTEFFQFHISFKPWLSGFDTARVIDLIGLGKVKDKPLQDFSSGMMQRVKLAQCFFSDTTILLLDEPCSNLDASGVHLYQQLVEDYSADRIVIIASNDPRETAQCTRVLSLEDFK